MKGMTLKPDVFPVEAVNWLEQNPQEEMFLTISPGVVTCSTVIGLLTHLFS